MEKGFAVTNCTLTIAVNIHVFDNKKLLWWVENEDRKNSPNYQVNFSIIHKAGWFLHHQESNQQTTRDSTVFRKINTQFYLN